MSSRSALRVRVVLGVGTVLGLAALTLPATAAKPVVSVLWADKAGDAKPAELDLLKGSVSCDRDHIYFHVNVANIDLTKVKGNLVYQVYRVKWTQDGTVRFADAALSYSGDTAISKGVLYKSFADGKYYQGIETLEQSETGTIKEGKNALVTIQIKLQNIGLATGSKLTKISTEALAYPWYAFYLGAPTPQVTGKVIDSAASKLNVTVGKGVCKATK